MIVTPLKPLELPLVDASLQPMGMDRVPGLHHSDLIRAMRDAAGAKITGVEGEDPATRPLLGFLYERVVSAMWSGVPYRDALESVWKEYLGTVNNVGSPDRGAYIETQLRLMRDGVAMTPDGFDAPHRLESYKLTWKSMKKWTVGLENGPIDTSQTVWAGEEHFWSWLRAEMSYLGALSIREGYPILTCRFFVFWTQGDYSHRPGFGPQATYTDVTWTQAELDTHWRMMLRWRDYVLAKQKAVG